MKRNLITAGVDEVGRGCLAGPVVSAAVILNEKIELKLIKDSKKINFENRLKIAEYIKQNALAWHITYEEPKLIDDINILQSVMHGMHNCIREVIAKINTNIGQVQIFEGSSQFGKNAQSKMNNSEEFLRKELANKYNNMEKKVDGFE